MGKKNFSETIYNPACRALGKRPMVKISALSDRYDPNSNFAGVIFYAHDGAFMWSKEQSVTGYSGRMAYIMIKNTDQWSSHDFKAAGQGRVHDKMYREVLGCEWNEGRTACGGFAIMESTIKNSSIWLNMQSGSMCGLEWESDGSKFLSDPEAALVNYAVLEWASRGCGLTLPIDDALHAKLSGGSVPSTPRGTSGSAQKQLRKKGTRVVRGQDWKWGEQDSHGVGTTEGDADSSLWISVRWDSGNCNNYRVGADGGRWDLALASASAGA